jgi:hypothetical protein
MEPGPDVFGPGSDCCGAYLCDEPFKICPDCGGKMLWVELDCWNGWDCSSCGTSILVDGFGVSGG